MFRYIIDIYLTYCYLVLEPDALRGARPDLRGGLSSNAYTLPAWFYQWFYIFVVFI